MGRAYIMCNKSNIDVILLISMTVVFPSSGTQLFLRHRSPYILGLWICESSMLLELNPDYNYLCKSLLLYGLGTVILISMLHVFWHLFIIIMIY
jgi:hypothetical protein